MDAIHALNILAEAPRKKPTRSPRAHREHPHKGFFRARGIRQGKVAQALGVDPAYLSEWFNGLRNVPKELEARLDELVGRVRSWERKNGQTFGPGAQL